MLNRGEPLIVARTERQILRELVPDDAEALFALSADPAVLRYTGDVPFGSVDDARRFLAGYDPYRREGMGRWAAIEIATQALIGWCGLRRQADGEVDLGYRYRRSAWGYGFASEASRSCLAVAFGPLALSTVIARAHPENAASIRVMTKLGFHFERTEEFEGMPAVLYRLDADEWRGS